MKLLFMNIADDNQKEFLNQLEIVYKRHFQISTMYKEELEDAGIHVISIPNHLYFEDIEKAKAEMYEAKNNGDEPYMKDFLSDLQENLSFFPSVMSAREAEYDVNYSFTIEEMKQIKAWQDEHRKKNHSDDETYQGPVGVERFEYTILETSIGVIRKCFCKSCKVKYEEERCKKLDELRKKWDYQIDFSDW